MNMGDQFDYTAPKAKEEILNREVKDTKDIQQESIKFIHDLLLMMISKKASDLFITAGFPPAIKLDGMVKPITDRPLSSNETSGLAMAVMNEKQKNEFEKSNEANFAVAPTNIGRFRVNVFRQQGKVGMVFRVINTQIPNIEDLKIPAITKKIAMEKRGLVIVVGATGSGKSTTLAAMVGFRNQNEAGHIVTIEDPIEFVHEHRKSIVTQREIGVDTESWEIALKNALRQAPDVILIGEIRDRDAMEYAISFAETGHLCFATLHANNANQALDRIINFFPEEKRQQLLMDLSLNLKGIISQRLIPSAQNGRIPAVEILLNTSYVSDQIFKGNVGEIKEIMKKSSESGMQTFDKALFDLYEDHKITFEDAIRNSDSATDLRLQIKLKSKRGLPAENNGNLNLQVME